MKTAFSKVDEAPDGYSINLRHYYNNAAVRKTKEELAEPSMRRGKRHAW